VAYFNLAHIIKKHKTRFKVSAILYQPGFEARAALNHLKFLIRN
jgi:hypothetical protein